MGPRRAAEAFRADLPATASRVRIALHGSLAATGRGHLTDIAVSEPFAPLPVELLWFPERMLPRHTNGIAAAKRRAPFPKARYTCRTSPAGDTPHN